MARHKHSLVWEVLSEEEWDRRNALKEASNNAPLPNAPPNISRWRFSSSRLWTALLVALFLTGSGLYIVWRQAQTGLARINTELDSEIEAEAWKANPQQGAKSKVTKVEMRDFSAGVAVVEVTTVNPAGDAYRNTQFYRQGRNNGWQRTSPDAGFWGAEQSVESAYFRWHFRARDQVAVTQVSKQADSFYQQLRHDLGLSPPSTTDKVIIDIEAGIQSSPLPGLANHLSVPSPLLLISPAQLSEVEALRGHLFLLLIQETIRLAQAQQPIWCIWRPLLGGLAQWQLHTYHSAPADGPPDSEVTVAPTGPTLKKLLSKDETCLDRPVNRIAAAPDDPETAALGETLFAYIVASYGREGIATAFNTFRHYSTWEDAIPAAFATRPDLFESEWQQYVAKLPPGQ